MITTQVNSMLFRIAHKNTKKNRNIDIKYAIQFGIEYCKAKIAYLQLQREKEQETIFQTFYISMMYILGVLVLVVGIVNTDYSPLASLMYSLYDNVADAILLSLPSNIAQKLINWYTILFY